MFGSAFQSLAGVIPNSGLLSLSTIPTPGTVTEYSGISGPTGFGSGSLSLANSSSGPPVTIIGGVGGFITSPLVSVPAGYTSDSVLALSTDTWNSASLTSLGVTPGIYVWTWGTGADQSFTLEIGPVATPLPAALPLFAAGISAPGLLGWRRKRKAQAVA